MKAEPKVLKHSMALEIVSLQYCWYTVGLSGVSLQYCRYTVGLSGVSSGNLQKLVPVSFYFWEYIQYVQHKPKPVHASCNITVPLSHQ